MQPEPQKIDENPTSSKAETMQFAVLGDFELRREIGRGGMGTVFEAWQISLQRVVALKVLAPHVASTSKAVSRFRREAQAAAKLHHTHIVPIYAQGEALGSYYYAMELVDGESLHAAILNLREQYRLEPVVDQAETVVLPHRSSSTATTTKKIDVAGISDSAARKASASSGKSLAFGTHAFFHDVARHLAEVADALEYAHANGVIHRDIKPHNLLFGSDGRLRISDFGLARLAEQPGVTMTGEVLGSPLYMSPEQITGDPNAVDHRTDIYSLGATMYEWITLSPPYPGETRERVISRILSSEPNHPRSENPAVPLDLETICMKAIDRDLNRRYRSAGEMRDDLRRYLLSAPISARRAGPVARGLRFLARHQIASLLVAAIMLGSGLLIALFMKDRRVQVEQAAAVKAKAEVVVAKEAVVDAMSDKDIFKALANMVVPGGGAIAEKVANTDLSKTSLPTPSISSLTPKIFTPSEIALRAVKTFYSSVADKDWPDEKIVPAAGVDSIDRARSRWAEGDNNSAQEIISQYIAQLPPTTIDAEALQMRAALNAVLGRYDAMLADADQLLGAGTPNGYVWRGIAKLLLNDIKPSLRDLDSAKIGEQGQQFQWINVFRGFALLQSEKIDEAREQFEDVLKEPPTSLAAHLGLGVTAHLGRALALHAQENCPAVLEEVEQVLKSDAKNIYALTLRGDCRTYMRDYEGALRDYKEAMSIAGYQPELLARYLAVTNRQDALKSGLPEGSEVKSRHGTEQPDKSAPPVFKWLRQRMPANESGAMQPESRILPLVRLRFPIP